MHYQFSFIDDCLKAELTGRESIAETQAFIRATVEQATKARCPRILMAVRRSRPIFKVEQYRISDYFKEIAANPAVRVALVGDSDELRAAHEHIELLARSSGANVRAFGDEAKALAWLREALQSQEKR
jgi:hypothetical protein